MSTEMPKQTDPEAALAMANELLREKRGELQTIRISIGEFTNRREETEAFILELEGQVTMLQHSISMEKATEVRREWEKQERELLANPPDREQVSAFQSQLRVIREHLRDAKIDEIAARRNFAQAIIDAGPTLDVEVDTTLPGMEHVPVSIRYHDPDRGISGETFDPREGGIE